MRAQFYRYVKKKDDPGELFDGTWEELVNLIGPHRVTDATNKIELPCVSPGTLKKGTTRGKRNVDAIWFAVLDLDDTPATVVETVLSRCRALGLAFAFWTTWQHPKKSKGVLRARLAVPFTVPVFARDWPLTYPLLAPFFGAPNSTDTHCSDASRVYYLPFSRIEDFHLHVWINEPGRFLDPKELEAADVLNLGEFQPGTRKVDRSELAPIIRRWRKDDKTFFRRTMTKALENLEKGLPFAEEGDRDDRAYQLAADLARELPGCDPKSIAELFRPSLSLMPTSPGNPAPTLENIADKSLRAYEQVYEEQLEARQDALSLQRASIARAFSHVQPGRTHRYTDDEIAEFAAFNNTTVEDFSQQWVIYRGGDHYIWVYDTYIGPLTSTNLEAQIGTYLAPAPVALFDADGNRKSLTRVFEEYASPAITSRMDLTAKKARYDPTTKTLTEAPCPLRDLKPEYDPEVEAWLDLLAGERGKIALRRWLALCPDLSKTLSVLLLTDTPGVGKNLLAHGIASLWSSDATPIPLHTVLGKQFNVQIASMPVLFADEKMPADFRGNMLSEELRSLVSGLSHTIERKYHNTNVAVGAVRVIAAANNQGILSLKGSHLTSHDIQATSERFFHVACLPEAKEWLEKCDTHSFTKGGRIARHILYLSQQPEYTRQKDGRFWVASPDATFHRKVAMSSGNRAPICELIYTYLLNPRVFDARKSPFVKKENGNLFIHVEAIKELWKLYFDGRRLPDTSELGASLIAIAPETEVFWNSDLKKSVRLRRIDPKNVAAWAVQSGVADETEVAELFRDPPREETKPDNAARYSVN